MRHSRKDSTKVSMGPKHPFCTQVPGRKDVGVQSVRNPNECGTNVAQMEQGVSRLRVFTSAMHVRTKVKACSFQYNVFIDKVGFCSPRVPKVNNGMLQITQMMSDLSQQTIEATSN